METDPKAPKGKSGAVIDFATAMEETGNPELGAGSEMTDEEMSANRRRAAAARAGRLKDD